MKLTRAIAIWAAAVSVALSPVPSAARCSLDSVQVGPSCVDAYEASIWQVSAADGVLVRKIKRGLARLTDLVAAGAVPLGCLTGQSAYPPSFPPTGNWTAPVWRHLRRPLGGEHPMGPNPAPTGSRAACVSSWGVFDMVGNIYEWVGDWSERPVTCSAWPPAYGDDYACVGGNGTVPIPTALARGGYFGLVGGSLAGQFAVVAINQPSVGAQGNGFRCGR